MAAYMYNCSSTLRQYAKYNERHLSPLKVVITKLTAPRELHSGEGKKEDSVIFNN